MSTGLALLNLAAVAVAGAVAWVARGRRRVQRVRRLAALEAVAERVGAAIASLPEPTTPQAPERLAQPGAAVRPPPLAPDAPPGRVALIDSLADAVERARADGSRLTAAIVDTKAAVETTLANLLRETANAPVYVVGPRAVALVLPGFGRAAALGVLARIQAAHGLHGHVVELGPGDDALEMAARVLGHEGD